MIIAALLKTQTQTHRHTQAHTHSRSQYILAGFSLILSTRIVFCTKSCHSINLFVRQRQRRATGLCLLILNGNNFKYFTGVFCIPPVLAKCFRSGHGSKNGNIIVVEKMEIFAEHLLFSRHRTKHILCAVSSKPPTTTPWDSYIVNLFYRWGNWGSERSSSNLPGVTVHER